MFSKSSLIAEIRPKAFFTVSKQKTIFAFTGTVQFADVPDAGIEMVRGGYDVWNRLIRTAITKGGKVTETGYTYNGGGLRQLKTAEAVVYNLTLLKAERNPNFSPPSS